MTIGRMTGAMRNPRAVRLLIASCLIVVLGGCASSYQVVRLPEREADLYPLSQTQADVTIAIDEITSAARGERYFGANLAREGILPLAVIVSNSSRDRVLVKPSDILVHQGKEVVDPLPLETVIDMAKSGRWFMRDRTEKQVERYFKDLAFSERVLVPGESYQGIMFFPAPRPPRSSDSFFRVLNLFGEGGPRVRVGVRNAETQQRLLFGPFNLSVPEDRRTRW